MGSNPVAISYGEIFHDTNFEKISRHKYKYFTVRRHVNEARVLWYKKCIIRRLEIPDGRFMDKELADWFSGGGSMGI